MKSVIAAQKMPGEESFMFITRVGVYSCGPMVKELYKAHARGLCWRSLKTFKVQLEEDKKSIDMRDKLIILINPNDSQGKFFKKILLPPEMLKEAEEKKHLHLRLVFEKKMFISRIPPVQVELKKSIQGQKGLPVIVIDFGVLEVFSI